MATSGGVEPAPAGQTTNLVDPPTRTAANIAMYTVLLAACSICLGIRMFTRIAITHSFAFDDAFCLAGFAFLVTYSGLMLACGNYYLGRHIWDVTLSDLIYGAKLEVWAEWSYLVISGTVKLSILLLYVRIFGPFQRITPVLWTGVVAVSLIYVVLLVMSVLDCQPINRHWDPYVDGKCLPSGVLAYSSGAFNVATDVFVLLVPMPTIWFMNLSLTKKLRVSSVFGVGIFVVSMSITRLAKTPLVFKSTDPSWDLSDFSIYSILELSFGFMCCCILTFPALFDRYGANFKSWVRSRTWNSSANSRGPSSPPVSEKPNDSPRTNGNDKRSFTSFNSGDARLTFITEAHGHDNNNDLEGGELSRDVSSSMSRLGYADIE